MEEKVILNMFYSNETIFHMMTSMQEMLEAAQLFVLKTAGGLILPQHSLVLSVLQPLLYYEAVLDEAGLVVGGHSCARLWQEAINMYLQGKVEDRNMITMTADTFPDMVTRIGTDGPRYGGEHIMIQGREASILLLRRDVESLKKVYKYSLVILEKEMLESTAVARMDNLGTILRTLWSSEYYILSSIQAMLHPA